MATIVNFFGKKIIEPGVYAKIQSGIPATPVVASSGDVAIIDTGKGLQFGGGSGINGYFANGLNSIYQFDDVDDFKNFVKGGLFYDLADYLFSPNTGQPGTGLLYYIRACTTTPSEMEISLEGGSNLKILCKNEGETGNGYMNEVLGESVIRFNQDTVIANNVVSFNVDSVQIGEYTLTSNSLTEMLNGISSSINSGTSGYTAKVQGTALIILSKRNHDPETDVLTSTGTVTVNNSDLKFIGYKEGENLIYGYGFQIEKSDDIDNAYVLRIFQGTFSGYNVNGNSISGLTESESFPNLVYTSDEFTNFDDLVQILKTDYLFNKLFKLDDDYIQVGTGDITENDVTKYEVLNLAVNGTSVYNPSDYDKVLDDIRELQNEFFLSDRYGDEARGVHNSKLLDHINNDAEFTKFIIIGGGSDESKFDVGVNSSIEIAKFYDTTSVIVAHSGETKYNTYLDSKEKLPSIYFAANLAGLLGGLEPQVPATYKKIRISEFNHTLGLKQREKALKYGVLHGKNVAGIGMVVNQSINSIQKNTILINPDGTSHENSIMRIGGQLNKELILNMRPIFVGNNWGQASPEEVKSFVEGYLFSRTVTDTTDNLILSFKNVTVKQTQDYYEIKYCFVPNGPLNKLFITGFMIDANLSA